MEKFLVIPIAVALVLAACTTPNKKAEREPAQAVDPQYHYANLYQSLGEEKVAKSRILWEEYLKVEYKNFVCFDDDNVGYIMTGQDVYQRRNRRFSVMPNLSCKILNDRPQESVQEAELRK